jgi:hypothetical protein
MACPFFMPTHRIEQGSWLHPSRLPLGAGWDGHCTVPGHVGDRPHEQNLKESCNLGYAAGCSWFPSDHAWDSVRFAVERKCEDRVLIVYACEKKHRPRTHGTLEFDSIRSHWTKPHEDPRVQRMAECYLESYFNKQERPATDLLPQTSHE